MGPKCKKEPSWLTSPKTHLSVPLSGVHMPIHTLWRDILKPRRTIVEISTDTSWNQFMTPLRHFIFHRGNLKARFLVTAVSGLTSLYLKLNTNKRSSVLPSGDCFVINSGCGRSCHRQSHTASYTQANKGGMKGRTCVCVCVWGTAPTRCFSECLPSQSLQFSLPSSLNITEFMDWVETQWRLLHRDHHSVNEHALQGLYSYLIPALENRTVIWMKYGSWLLQEKVKPTPSANRLPVLLVSKGSAGQCQMALSRKSSLFWRTLSHWCSLLPIIIRLVKNMSEGGRTEDGVEEKSFEIGSLGILARICDYG